MGTRVLAATAALVATLLVAPPADAGDAGKASKAKAYGHAAVVATNAARAGKDIKTLDGSKCLQRFARSHAKEMADEGEIWHQDLGDILAGCGLNFVGENVAAGFADGASVVDDGWMKSEGHRKNILTKEFEIVAVVARRDGDGRWYACQLFGRLA